MSRNYPRLKIEDFGSQLLTTGDLDPVYIALCSVDWSRGKIARWLVAYWCFYHCGAASFISEHKGGRFWDWMQLAAENTTPTPLLGDGSTRWPRAKERRHFRGMQAINAVRELRENYPTPEYMVKNILTQGNNFSDVSKFVRTHRGFGPWIAFKVCDMMERIFSQQIDFSEAEVFMFKDPTEAALMQFRIWNNLVEDTPITNKQETIHIVVEYLKTIFSNRTAPPHNDRPVGLQEIETILCKWKSHHRGHYPLYNDIDEITSGLEGWGGSSYEFIRAMPRR